MRLVRAFVAAGGGDPRGAAGRSSRARVRAHLARCPDCDAAYHELVEGVARFSRVARGGEQDRAGTHAEAAHRAADQPGRAAIDDEIERPPTRRRNLLAADAGRRFRLPKLFFPLAAICAVVAVVGSSGPSGLVLRATAGEVLCDRATIQVADPARPLVHGSVVSTGDEARAEIVLGESSIAIAPSSAILVERPSPISLRLFTGNLRVHGDATIATRAGVVTAFGCDADLELGEDRVAIRVERGAVSLVDGGGTHAIEAGTTARFDLPREPAREE